MILSTLLSVLAAAVTIAADPALRATTRQGIYEGFPASGNMESWLGVPYAQPPLGDLRFRAPQPLTSTFNGIRNASTFGNACPQPPRDTLGAAIGEDCLVLNIFRPRNTRRNARLPVLVWFHGGRYTNGAASNAAHNPSRILQRSVQIGKPIIFVSVNYRVNAFGFLATSLLDASDLNAGLQDQAESFRFLRDNIAAFGGDPRKVTIWGQSAGAGSVIAHVVYPPPGPGALFRAVIANSETGPFKHSPPPEVYDREGKPFNRLLELTGCQFGPEALACLRGLPFLTVQNASIALLTPDPPAGQVWQPTIGAVGAFADERASERINRGDFLNVPILAGTVLNEGNTFSSSLFGRNLRGQAEEIAFELFIRSTVVDDSTMTPETISTIQQLYRANDPTLGGRFNTGDSLFDRGAAWYTENMYLEGTRRLFARAAERGQRLWGFRYQEFSGNNRMNGVSHGSELAMLFGPVPSIAQMDFANQMLDFYINFIADLNPGSRWPSYTSEAPDVLQLIRGNITPIPDDFNKMRTDFLNSGTVLAEFQK